MSSTSTVETFATLNVTELSGTRAARAFFSSLRDPLGTAARIKQEHGDFVLLRAGRLCAALLGHPRYVDDVLGEQNAKFGKDKRYRSTPRLLGGGLLTADGEAWRTQRRIAQPAFQNEHIASYEPAMVESADRILASWRVGDERDVHRDAMAMALAIVGRALFAADITTEAGEMARTFLALLEHWNHRATSVLPVLDWLPSPRNIRFRRAIRRLEGLFEDVVERRLGEDPDCAKSDLLALLLQARSANVEGAQKLLRDEFVTMTLAGYETTANSVSWTLFLLSQHPAVEARLVEELRTVGDAPLHDRLGAFQWLGAVICESLRLYPPVWGFGREALEETRIGGHTVERGTQIFICPYLNHRDPRFFSEPARFQPERWLNGAAKRLPSGAYLPFGRGARMCIGRNFAMLETSVILARMLPRFRLRLVPGFPVFVQPGITLRPRHGLRMVVEARS